MCGLFGHTYGKKKLGLPLSRQALNTMEHRGPDQWGEWHDEDIYIGHRRLSILDLSENARQPMIGRSVVLTANGEIWNFKELREELEQKHSFKSQSDSEVLLHGYIEWGFNKLLERIDGMFAFSIYDSKIKK